MTSICLGLNELMTSALLYFKFKLQRVIYGLQLVKYISSYVYAFSALEIPPQ